MSKKIVIYIDMDGVLCGDPHPSKIEELCQNNKKLLKRIRRSKSHWSSIPNIFLHLPIKDGAKEAFEFISEHFESYIVSCPTRDNLTSYTHKAEWIKEHLGYDVLDRLVLTRHKDLLKSDDTTRRETYIIDDRLVKGVTEYGEYHIHFGTERYPNWDAVVNFLKTLI
jgi:5'(3')-deoxyribonucleotidase